MLPGGTDVVIRVADPLGRRDRVVAIVRATWPSAVIEDADTGGPLCAGTEEILAYRDALSFISWQQYGATTTNGDDMLHVIFDDHTITCVIDGPDTSAMAEQVRAMTTAG